MIKAFIFVWKHIGSELLLRNLLRILGLLKNNNNNFKQEGEYFHAGSQYKLNYTLPLEGIRGINGYNAEVLIVSTLSTYIQTKR